MYRLYSLIFFIFGLLLSSCGSGTCYKTTQYAGEVYIDGSNGGIIANTTDASVKPIIQLKFSTAVVPTTVNSTTVAIYPSTQTTENSNTRFLSTNNSQIKLTSFTSSPDNTTFTFSPVDYLNPNTKYEIVVKNGVVAQKGGLIKPISTTFVTGTDSAPTVVLLQPQNSTSNVASKPIINLQFSKNVLNANTQTVKICQDILCTESVLTTSNMSGQTLTLTPISNLADNTKYYIVFKTGITNSSNQALVQPVDSAFSFTTGEFSAPSALMLSPHNNAININQIPAITVQFSEIVKNLNNDTVKLYKNLPICLQTELGPDPNCKPGQDCNLINICTAYQDNYVLESSINISMNNFDPVLKELTFVAPTLLANTLYSLVLESTITDLAGKSLVSPSIFSFTTGDTVAPSVIGSSPRNGSVETTNILNQVVIGFSENVTNVDGNVSLVSSAAPAISLGTPTCSSIPRTSGMNCVFNSFPPVLLTDGVNYSIVLNNNIMDLAGNSLVGTNINFTYASAEEHIY